jgi:hypothetical protein
LPIIRSEAFIKAAALSPTANDEDALREHWEETLQAR